MSVSVRTSAERERFRLRLLSLLLTERFRPLDWLAVVAVMAENGPQTISRQAKAPCIEASPHHQLMRDPTVQLSCNPLCYDYFASLTTEPQTG